MKLTRKELRITNGASDEKARPVLTNVLLRRGMLIAADGFMAVSMPATMEDGDNIDRVKDLQLPSEMLNKIHPGTGYVKLEQNQDGTLTASIFTKPKKGRYSYSSTEPKLQEPKLVFTPAQSGNYPLLYDRIPTVEKKAVVALNTKLLKKVLACLPDDCTVRFGIGDPTEPVEFAAYELENSDDMNNYAVIRGMIMPMFVSWEYNKWAKDDPNWRQPEAASVTETVLPGAGTNMDRDGSHKDLEQGAKQILRDSQEGAGGQQ